MPPHTSVSYTFCYIIPKNHFVVKVKYYFFRRGSPVPDYRRRDHSQDPSWIKTLSRVSAPSDHDEVLQGGTLYFRSRRGITRGNTLLQITMRSYWPGHYKITYFAASLTFFFVRIFFSETKIGKKLEVFGGHQLSEDDHSHWAPPYWNIMKETFSLGRTEILI